MREGGRIQPGVSGTGGVGDGACGPAGGRAGGGQHSVCVGLGAGWGGLLVREEAASPPIAGSRETPASRLHPIITRLGGKRPESL